MGRAKGPPRRRPSSPAGSTGVKVPRAGPLAARALAGDHAGRVAAAHRRAVNLLLDDGPLVTLLPAGSPLHPWAITAALVASDLARLAEGDRVRVTAAVLEVGPLRVALAGVEVADLRVARRPAALSKEDAGLLWRRSVSGADGGPFDESLSKVLRRFTRGGDVGGLAALVGLGEGLTPSGDDVIVGVLGGLDAAREASPLAAPARASLVEALAGRVARETTLPSAQMIEAAAEGLYAEPVLDVLHVLADVKRTPAALERSAAALLALGHRSGRDTLRGIAAGLEHAARG